MSEITKGHTYNSGDQVTSSNLTTLVTGLDISSITRADVDLSVASLVTRQDTRPAGPQEKELWQDSSDQDVVVTYVTSSWLPAFGVYKMAQASADVSAGDVLMSTGMSSEFGVATAIPKVRPISVSGSYAIGVATSSISSGSTGIMCVRGMARGRVDSGSGIVAGNLLYHGGGVAGGSGLFVKASQTQLNAFAIATSSPDASNRVWVWLRQ